jgi:uncharacterized lipoprotein YddW (UPF0748 family)
VPAGVEGGWGARLRLAALLALSGCALATSEPAPPAPPADLPPPSAERPRPDPSSQPAPEPGVPPGENVRPDRGWSPARVLLAGESHPLPATLPDEVRALWIVRTALVHPDSIDRAVDRAASGGFNTLLVQVRGRGDAWYRSSLEPRALQLEARPPEFDPLAHLLARARARGLQVHAWVNVHLVSSAELLPTDPRHMVHARPDWLALPRALAGSAGALDPHDPRYLAALVGWTRANANIVEGIYSSPANPEVARHVRAVVAELVARYALDGVHLDYVRHPSPAFDHSRGAVEAFRRWLVEVEAVSEARLATLSPPRSSSPGALTALPDAFPAAWDRFRRAALTDLVRDLRHTLELADPRLLLSAAVFPDLRTARDARYQPWDAWLAEGPSTWPCP